MEFHMKEDTDKICILIPYFGNWPGWFPYFLLSCIHNPEIDWYFFSDSGELPLHNKNLFLIHITLNDFNILASRKLQLPVEIKYAYKMCDLKPAYGRIFEDYIKGYNFWGYGDLDLIYGNIRQILTKNILSENDIISCHSEFVSGHLCILRNSPEILDLYRNGGHYESVFRNKYYQGFDEQFLKIKIITNPKYSQSSKKLHIFFHVGTFQTYKIIKWLVNHMNHNRINRFRRKQKYSKLKDFTSIVKHNQKQETLKVHFNTLFLDDLILRKNRKKDWKVIWDEGKLTEPGNSRFILYFHFMISKTKRNFHISKFNPLKSKIVITKKGIQSF